MAATAFSKAQRKGLLRRLSLAAMLTLSLAPSAQAQVVNNVPSSASSRLSQGFNQAAIPPVPADLKSYVSNPADAPEITAIKAEFAKTEMGIALLRFAKDHDIKFVLAPDLPHKALYTPATSTISIRPGQKLEGLMMYTAHEIRHGWQDKVLGAIDMENGVMTPWQRWTLRRYLEADAEAFSAFFEADRLRSGIHMQPGFGEAMPASMIAMRLRGEFWSKDGLNFGEYRQMAFEPALERLHTYNRLHLDYVEEVTLNFGKQVLAAGNDKAKLAALEAQVQNAPSDAAFEAFLRHLGGVSLNPERQTSLQSTSVTRETLLNDYPRRMINPRASREFPPVLDKSIADMTALQDGYIRVLHNTSGKKPALPKPGA
ncbi:MAG: hypothetical protein EPN97_05630 [Alphaproteobacteria bacterium]|nr:MAG: hypothetical protein EPN97_05630 [Alphaproteobacteria bacterium]